MPTVVLRKEWEHYGKQYQKGGASVGTIWLKKESRLRSFEKPAAADKIVGLAFEGDTQTPEQLESEARDLTNRKLQDMIAGPIDHVSRNLRMEVRPPLQLTGSDNVMGAEVLEAICGDGSMTFPYVAAPQTERAIVSIVNYDETKTTLRIAGVVADFPIGSVWGFRSKQAESVHFDNQPTVLTKATDAGGGNFDLEFVPSLFGEPQTADKMQPGVTWLPALNFDKTWSVVNQNGFDSDQYFGGTFASMTMTLDRRSILVIEAVYEAIRSLMTSVGFCHGESGNDTLLATDKVLDFAQARCCTTDCWVNLYKIDVATGLVVATETEAQVEDRDITNRTVTLNRGAGAFAVAGAQGLQAKTLAAQHKVIAGATVLNDFFRIELDWLGEVDIPMQVQAAYDVTHAIADVHAKLRYDSLYGRLTIAPLVAPVDYASGVAADAGGGELELSSKSYGSQSCVRAIDTKKAQDKYTQMWTPAPPASAGEAWIVTADFEVQMWGWDPGGTVSLDPIPTWEGLAVFEGSKMKAISTVVNFSNDLGWLEDVRTGDQYAEGHAEGPKRAVTLAVSSPQYGYLSLLKDFAARSEGVSIGAWVGASVGGTLSVFSLRAKTSSATKSGDNRVDGAYTLTATDPALAGFDSLIPEIVIGLT